MLEFYRKSWLLDWKNIYFWLKLGRKNTNFHRKRLDFWNKVCGHPVYLKNEQMESNDFLHACTNENQMKIKLKGNWKFWGVGMVKNGCGQSGVRTLKLNVYEEWTDERTTDVLHVDTDSQKFKRWSKNVWVGMVKNGCGCAGHGTLKLTVPQKWTNGISWFFACWYKFGKAKSWFNDFWVGLVKNSHSLVVYETLKSAAS